MVKENIIPIENKKPTETAYEIKDEYKVPSFEEFMETYEADEKVIDSYRDELESYDSLGERKVCGPMYRGDSSSDNHFSISYSFKHGVDNEKYFFEESGSYSNSWKISGDLGDLVRYGLNKLGNDEVRVFKLVSGYYERNRNQEEEIRGCLLEDIAKFMKMKENGRVEYNGTGREFNIPRSRTIE
jgi:hypothetical protein